MINSKTIYTDNDDSHDEKVKFVIEELSHLQEIIGRQDNLKALCKRFYITIFATITVVYSNSSTDWNVWSYFTVVSSTAVLFLIMEGFYGVTEQRAEDRVRDIEGQIQDGLSNYFGPEINVNLVVKTGMKNVSKAMARGRTCFIYCASILALFIYSCYLTFDFNIEKLCKFENPFSITNQESAPNKTNINH